MKARDLAALAALGIAGKMAYDKFGRKKDDEPKTKGKLGEAQSANDGDAGEFEARAQKAELGTKGAYLDDTPEFRTKGAYLDDTPELRTKGAYLDERATPAASASSAYKKVKDKSSGAVAAKATAAKAADTKDDRFVSPEEGAKANKPRRTPGAADGVGSTPSTTEAGMANYTPRRTPPAVQVPSTTEEGMANYTPRRTVADYSNEGRNYKAPAVASTTEAGMVNYTPRRPLPVPQVPSTTEAGMKNYTPRRTTTASDNAQAQARMMRQGSPMAASRRNAGMPGYDEAGNPISMRSMAGRPGYDEAGNKMKRGGAVKMASGGMTSSKMSKPSGASRGDGIAQRGRTRGTLR